MTASQYDGIVITAPVSVPYQQKSDTGAQTFIGAALAQLIKAIEKKDDIDGLAVSSLTLAPDSAVTLTEYFGLTLRWLEQVPLGGASGVVAFRRAASAIKFGDAEIIACIGGDTAKPGGFREIAANFSTFTQLASYPYGAAGPNGPFSLITQHYMDRFGATREDFGRLCMAQRYNAAHYPHALFRDPLTMDDYLSARPIAGPLHLYDCVMPCAGAEAFLVMSAGRARRLGLQFATVLAAEEIYNAHSSDEIQYRLGHDLIRDKLYKDAGLGPDDMNLVQTYDDYPVIAMMQLEDLGFCEKGEAARLIRDTDTRFDGDRLPHNTSGGQLSCGQAGAAGGFLGFVEALRQVTGQALGNQVENARTACVSGYGMVNYDRGLAASAAILKGARAS